MKLIPVTESMFLVAETRDQPMHVGGLQLFVPREGQTQAELADEFHDAFVGVDEIQQTFRKRPASPARIAGYFAWQYDDELDLDYHVRRIVLPRPGAVRDLLSYVSLNHGTLLDRSRPMWELHIIEGLEDGRVALFSKVHHSVVDGVTALRMLQRALSTDPKDRTGTAFWDQELLRRRRRARAAVAEAQKSVEPSPGLLDRVGGAIGAALSLADDVVGVVPATAKVAVTSLSDIDYVPPVPAAPRTPLNVSIGSARRFAAQDWPTERIRAVARKHGVTTNDIILAMTSGALRTYLTSLDGLPHESLTAMVPVSLHDGEKDGNAVTAILVKLATDLPSAIDRLGEITRSTVSAKTMVRGLRPIQQLALGAANMWPAAMSLVPGVADVTPNTFNLVISNVPGTDEPLYWNGARLDGCYPASIAIEGQAMNVTITSVAGKTGFGVVGARAELPHLQRMLDYLDDELVALESAPAK